MPTPSAARGEHSYVDAEGVTIHYYVWRPRTPKAVVHLVHGLGEYARRYELFAQDLVAAGYAVYAGDLRGHGQTEPAQLAEIAAVLLHPGLTMAAQIARVDRVACRHELLGE